MGERAMPHQYKDGDVVTVFQIDSWGQNDPERYVQDFNRRSFSKQRAGHG
jgi:hypothetical protein